MIEVGEMFSWNTEQEKRQLNYERYRKLTKYGHSISSEVSAQEALYVVNTDPFGRSYYEKPVGKITRVDVTGRQYEVEGWAVKEFIIDNKIQLVNKVSADLLMGKAPAFTFDEAAPEELEEWFEEDVEEKLKLSNLLLEGALKVSALGDIFLMPYVRNDQLKLKLIEPDYVDVKKDQDNEIQSFVYAWELDKVKTGVKRIDSFLAKEEKVERDRKRMKLLRIKEFFKGRIEHSIRVLRDGKLEEEVSLEALEPELFKQAESAEFSHIKFQTEAAEGKELQSMTIVEYTGIDEFLFIHWPNYRLMDYYGQSDNGMVESLQNALNNRETQLNDILDKHADPAMAGPSGFMDAQGNLRMSGGGGRYFPVDKDDAVPQYLTWNGHLAETQEEMKRIYKAICDNDEVAMSLTGMETSGVESGRALMYRLVRSLAMKSRKGMYAIAVLEELVRTFQKLRIVWIEGKGQGVGEEPKEEWEGEVFWTTITLKDNLPLDVAENIQTIVNLVMSGLLSKETGVELIAKYVEEVTPADELVKIKKEQLEAAAQTWGAASGALGNEGEEGVEEGEGVGEEA
jgi:hypothetical protein